MILSDLLTLPVLDGEGNRLGTVVDARFVIEDAPQHTLGDARLYGLIVSRHTTHSFMGYERTGTQAPAVIARFLRWRARGSFLILWKDIRSISRERVQLRAGYIRYSPRLTQEQHSSGRK